MRKQSIPKLHSIRWKDGLFAENVEHLDCDAHEPVDPIVVLQGAAEAMLTEIVIAGYDQQGREYVATSSPDVQRAAYLFARGQLIMLRIADG